ncbi:DNA adenine methylase [Cellulosimicrobium marinum]|uniref:DNA adenine methylase n=1 Tax=Cellulosimicrobium marinum TaxID=1638992 RepID=UPI001E6088F9|nr:DNA adenine methylase [Cellulosimicrobium marinum]MCB7136199.1 DNA adenine methylase [Cellulosimicrobium marinum]
MNETTQNIRPIHYMGNKSRYLNAIENAVDGVARPGAACDLFAGTGVVSRRLASHRPVVSSDVQKYSQILVNALTNPQRYSPAEVEDLEIRANAWLLEREPALRALVSFEESALAVASRDPAALAEVIESGSLAAGKASSDRFNAAKSDALQVAGPETSTLTWYYGGVYFSYRQALELDALLFAIRSSSRSGGNATAIASLMGTASDIVSTVGNHFAQPVQPRNGDGTLKRSWVASVVRSRHESVSDTFRGWLGRYATLRPSAHPCTALQNDYREVLDAPPQEIGVIYADPPYTRDHYSRFYHVLETIAMGDDPGLALVPGSNNPSRGLYRRSRHQSPFSIRTSVRHAFEELFANAKRLDVPIVLSYSPMSEGTKARPETRLVSIDEIASIAGGYFSKISIVDVESSYHSRFNRLEVNAKSSGVAEVLFVAEN